MTHEGRRSAPHALMHLLAGVLLAVSFGAASGQEDQPSATHKVYESWAEFMADVEAGRIEALVRGDPPLRGTFRTRSMIPGRSTYRTFEIPGTHEIDVSDEDWTRIAAAGVTIRLVVTLKAREIGAIRGNRWLMPVVGLILLAACAARWKHATDWSVVFFTVALIAILAAWTAGVLAAPPWVRPDDLEAAAGLSRPVNRSLMDAAVWALCLAYVLVAVGGVLSIVSSLKTSAQRRAADEGSVE